MASWSIKRLSYVILLLGLSVFAAACGQQTQGGGAPPAPPAATQTSAAMTSTQVTPATQTSAATALTSAAVAATATETQTTAAVATVTETTVTTTPETAATVPPGSFQNPVLRSDFPDPGVIYVDGVFYAYATNGAGKNIQAAKSTDLVRWELLPDAMPALPKWAQFGGGFVWAPEVIKVGDRYNMYYTARDRKADKQCVGVATSDRPDGRFKDTRDAALVCQVDEGGTIDPDPFRDGDKLYLYFKNDGNCCGMTTYLYGQELAPDGLSVVGQPARLASNDKAWEGRVVEAPEMLKRDGKYYLFYSANNYAGIEYAVGYATCQSPTGPCEDAPENPVLKSDLKAKPPVIGPGHQYIVDFKGKTWILYHAWEVTAAGKGDRRLLWIDQITWENGKPRVRGPTEAPQPMP